MRLGIIPRTRGLSADEAAALWIARLDRGELGRVDREEFDRWRTAPAHEAALARAKAVMDLFEIDDGSDAHLRALRQSALQAAPSPHPARRYAAAAAIALAITGTATIMVSREATRHTTTIASTNLLPGTQATTQMASANSGTTSSAPREYRTDIGERRTVRLSDGSRVTLDTGTRLAVAFDKGHRLVRLLHGQALFEVAHNRSWPFTVEAADRKVTALGTVFEVGNYPGRLHVTLIQGRVLVERTADAARQSPGSRVAPAILTPGQSLTAELGTPQQITLTDVSRELMWRDGFIEFDDETLSNAVAKINRYVRQPIQLSDDGTANLHVSGVFRTGNADRFIEAIKEILPVEVHSTPDGHIQLAMAPATANQQAAR